MKTINDGCTFVRFGEVGNGSFLDLFTEKFEVLGASLGFELRLALFLAPALNAEINEGAVVLFTTRTMALAKTFVLFFIICENVATASIAVVLHDELFVIVY